MTKDVRDVSALPLRVPTIVTIIVGFIAFLGFVVLSKMEGVQRQKMLQAVRYIRANKRQGKRYSRQDFSFDFVLNLLVWTLFLCIIGSAVLVYHSALQALRSGVADMVRQMESIADIGYYADEALATTELRFSGRLAKPIDQTPTVIADCQRIIAADDHPAVPRAQTLVLGLRSRVTMS